MSREQVEKKLRERIHAGIYNPGDRLPSERQLAGDFRVSRSTVQAAIDNLAKGGLLVQLPKCRPIVSQKAEDKVPPRPTRRHVAIWIMPKPDDLEAAMILKGIRSATEANGYLLVVGSPSTTHIHTEVEFLRGLVNRPDVAGAIVWGNCVPSIGQRFPSQEEIGIPVVFVDREPPETVEGDVVSTNNRRGARKAVLHLIGLGHRHIAMFVNTEHVSSVRDRVEGYRDALRSTGISHKSDLLFTYDPDELHEDLEGQVEFVRQVLARAPEITAIFCVNDGIALRIRQALIRCGLRVPEDISVVGFDWLLRSLPFGGDLTTVAQPFDAIGRIAAETLLERINSTTPQPSRHILLEAPLIARATTAPPRPFPITSDC